MTDQIERPEPRSLDSLDPRTGAVLAKYPVADASEIRATVARARSAARWWEAQGYEGRKNWLLEYKTVIARGAADLAAVITAETGKPDADALLEVMMGVEHIDWAARNAAKTLKQRRVRAGSIAVDQRAYVGYRPYGVVGVIGPWNYPMYTPMGSIAYSLAAGNTVVFKPSELTPGVGVWLADAWMSLAAPHPVFHTVIGDGASGEALCDSGVDKIAFTGSTATAKKVMATCARTLTPLVAECGGKDAMIVDADADISAAVEFAAFGAMGNAGQTCAGVERVYVAAPAYDRFVAELTTAVRALARWYRDGLVRPDDDGRTERCRARADRGCAGRRRESRCGWTRLAARPVYRPGDPHRCARDLDGDDGGDIRADGGGESGA